LEVQAAEKYRLELDDLQNKAIKANIFENAMQPIYNVIAMLGVIMVIYWGGIKVIEGGWTVGNFSAYMIMFAALATKASKAAKLFNSVQKSQISWQRIKPYLGEYKSKDPVPNFDVDHTGLVIENLRFQYPQGKENVISDISLTARQGEIIGVTAPLLPAKPLWARPCWGCLLIRAASALTARNCVITRRLSAVR
jgi:ABC-type bacteriocin/lantibiotic exporter with double-glycine peptidase domain